MAHSTSLQKLQVVYDLLFALSMGRRPVSACAACETDSYDLLLRQLETFGVALRELEYAAGIDPSSYSFARVVHFEFLLDASFSVANFNEAVVSSLGYAPEVLVRTSFDSLLTPASQDHWLSFLAHNHPGADFSGTIELVFVSESSQLLPLFCTVTGMSHGALFVVTSFKTFFLELVVVQAEGFQLRMHGAVGVAHALHDYIINHLDEPLPTLKKLAHLLGTEQTHLKLEFRMYYRCSPYHFYQEHRLKRAYDLILHTSLEFKEIAFMCGFQTYMNFYKVFKKKYGYAPSSVLRCGG